MRRSLGLGLGVMLAGLVTAPAQAETVIVAGTDALVWDKPVVDIKPNDTVEWTFPNTVQFHNVAIEFSSGVVRSLGGAPAPPFSQAFPAEGEYGFVCEVHRDTMRGVVRVSAVTSPPPPPPPPPPLSAQAFDNDAPTVVPAESNVTLDEAKPRLSSVSAKRVAKRAARVRFRVSENADVSVVVKRGARTVKRASASGTGTGSLTLRGLRAGRYTVQVRATDVAGNRSSRRTVRLVVR